VFRSSRTAQAALGVFLLCVLGLVAYRTYAPRLNARPTDDPVAIASPRPVDLNTAGREELLQLPGVGPSLADAILTHRGSVGRFDSVDDLNGVNGVGDKTLAKLRPLLTVTEPALEKLERKKPDPPAVVVVKTSKIQPGEPLIDVNAASEAELQRLPKVGPVLARAIVTARPFKSVDDLDRVKGIGAKTLDALRPFVTAGE
jgi:competence protein ComEA